MNSGCTPVVHSDHQQGDQAHEEEQPALQRAIFLLHPIVTCHRRGRLPGGGGAVGRVVRAACVCRLLGSCCWVAGGINLIAR